jgi:hypothetical protein
MLAEVRVHALLLGQAKFGRQEFDLDLKVSDPLKGLRQGFN